MEGSKSFSIDALLAKETPRKETVFPGPGPAGQKSPLLRSPGPSSPTDSHKGSYSPGSQGGRGSAGPSTASPGLHSPRHGSPREEGPTVTNSLSVHGPAVSPRGSFIPRPGLLNVHHARHPALAAAAGMFPGSALYNYPTGHPHVGPPGSASHQAAALSMLAGSAFHLPHEQALQAAQMHGVPLEWLARAGMLVHRPPDFAGKNQNLLQLVNYQHSTKV